MTRETDLKLPSSVGHTSTPTDEGVVIRWPGNVDISASRRKRYNGTTVLPVMATKRARGMLVPEATSDAKREKIADKLGESVRRHRDDNYMGNNQY